METLTQDEQIVLGQLAVLVFLITGFMIRRIIITVKDSKKFRRQLDEQAEKHRLHNVRIVELIMEKSKPAIIQLVVRQKRDKANEQVKKTLPESIQSLY